MFWACIMESKRCLYVWKTNTSNCKTFVISSDHFGNYFSRQSIEEKVRMTRGSTEIQSWWWISTNFVFTTQSTHIGESGKEKERNSSREKTKLCELLAYWGYTSKLTNDK